MNNAVKVIAISGAMAAVGGSIYLMCNPSAKRCMGKKAIKTLDNAEGMIAKKMI